MYYFITVYHNSIPAHLTRSNWEEFFKKSCISSAVVETDDGMLWNGSEEGGNVRSECEEDEGTACEDEDGDTDW
jgi:hypothetical protein